MSSEDDIIKHYDRFLDLADPLLNSHHLDDDKGDILFWYSFHPEDHAMLLYQLSKGLNPRWVTYFPLQQVFHTACEIFAQNPKDFQRELRDTLEQHPLPRGPRDDRRNPSCGPSLSQNCAQDIVQELEDKVTHRRRQARKDEDRELEKLIHVLYSFSIYEQQYVVLYRRIVT